MPKQTFLSDDSVIEKISFQSKPLGDVLEELRAHFWELHFLRTQKRPLLQAHGTRVLRILENADLREDWPSSDVLSEDKFPPKTDKEKAKAQRQAHQKTVTERQRLRGGQAQAVEPAEQSGNGDRDRASPEPSTRPRKKAKTADTGACKNSSKARQPKGRKEPPRRSKRIEEHTARNPSS